MALAERQEGRVKFGPGTCRRALPTSVSASASRSGETPSRPDPKTNAGSRSTRPVSAAARRRFHYADSP